MAFGKNDIKKLITIAKIFSLIYIEAVPVCSVLVAVNVAIFNDTNIVIQQLKLAIGMSSACISEASNKLVISKRDIFDVTETIVKSYVTNNAILILVHIERQSTGVCLYIKKSNNY